MYCVNDGVVSTPKLVNSYLMKRNMMLLHDLNDNNEKGNLVCKLIYEFK